MNEGNSYRGIQSIREIKERMAPLVQFYCEHRPDVQEVICSRADYDLIQRWPRAASVEGFVITDAGIFYGGLRLAHDSGMRRYDKPRGPQQDDILGAEQ